MNVSTVRQPAVVASRQSSLHVSLAKATIHEDQLTEQLDDGRGFAGWFRAIVIIELLDDGMNFASGADTEPPSNVEPESGVLSFNALALLDKCKVVYDKAVPLATSRDGRKLTVTLKRALPDPSRLQNDSKHLTKVCRETPIATVGRLLAYIETTRSATS